MYEKMLKIGCVFGDDFEQIIMISGEMMAFQYLGHSLNSFMKMFHLANLMALQADTDKT